MVRASKGFRRGTRNKLKKALRTKFKPNMFITDYKEGQSVIINHNPLSQSGMPHPRFKSMMGTIVKRRGDSYMVDVKVGKTYKHLIVKGEHLKPAENK